MTVERNPVGWFEIPVKEMARAKAFYEHVFAFELEEHQIGAELMAWFPMAEGVPGTSGSLLKAEGHEPSLQGVLIYFTTPDIEATLDRAIEKGGRVLVERTSIGEFGFVGLIEDSEGNRVGLHSRA